MTSKTLRQILLNDQFSFDQVPLGFYELNAICSLHRFIAVFSEQIQQKNLKLRIQILLLLQSHIESKQTWTFLPHTLIILFFWPRHNQLNGTISRLYFEVTLDTFGFPVGGNLAPRRAVFWVFWGMGTTKGNIPKFPFANNKIL